MNNREKNKLTMLQAIEAVINKNRETINSLPLLAEAVARFITVIAEILLRNKEFEGVKMGAVAAKNNALDDLIEHVFSVGNAIYAFGEKTGNERFKSTVILSVSGINRMRETDIAQYCSKIADLIKACPADLTADGVLAARIEAFNKALDAYQEQSDARQVKAAESMAARKALHECFDKADEILNKELDTLIEVVKTVNEDFYNQYKAARTIHDLGHGHARKDKKAGETANLAPLEIAKAA